MINIIVHGYKGKMGNVICRMVNEREGLQLSMGVDPAACDNGEAFPVYKSFSEVPETKGVIIDFSTAKAVPELIQYAQEHLLPVVICTTGLSKEAVLLAEKAAEKIPVFMSANMSLGINLMAELLKKCAPILTNSGFDIEIIEKHHNQKIDAPSGTAYLLADALNESLNGEYAYSYDRSSQREKRSNKEIGIASIRGGTIVGEHNVIFAGPNEVVELTHIAQSKEIFGAGAVKAAEFIADLPPGMYSMKDLIKDLL